MEASVDLVALLAALDARPALFAAEGHGSLFTYCTEVLRLSEDATCNRIQAARACRDLPVILEALIAELAPRPDVPSSVRKLPTATPAPTVMPATRVEAATPASPEPPPPI